MTLFLHYFFLSWPGIVCVRTCSNSTLQRALTLRSGSHFVNEKELCRQLESFVAQTGMWGQSSRWGRGARVSRGGPQNTPWASMDILLFELIKEGLWISHIPVPGQERGNNPWYLWLIWYDVSGHLPHTLASAPWSPFAAENHVTYFLRLRKVETASLAIRTDIINRVWEKDYPFETTISYTFLVTNTGECCQIFPRKLTPSLQVD